MKLCAWCSKGLEGKQKDRQFCDVICYKKFIRNGPDTLRQLRTDKDYWHKQYKNEIGNLRYLVRSRWHALKVLLGLI